MIENGRSELFSTALRKHLAGDLESAEALYLRILDSHPNDAETRHYLGFLLQQAGRLNDSCEQLAAAIAIDETRSEWHFNLGIVLSRLDRPRQAIEAFGSAIAIDPGRYFYWTNLGAAYESDGQADRAEQCYLRAAEIDPNCPDAYYLLSALFLKQARFHEARQFNCRGIIAAPEGKSKIVLSQSYYELGRIEEALSLLEQWRIAEPENAVAAHLLAAYRGQSLPDGCSRRYVEQTFDGFADSFENILGRLHYCGPELVGEHLATLDVRADDALDLGCGTGLVGVVLAPYCRRLVGVDLSRAMLDRAQAKGIYRQLHRSDITEFMLASSERYDLVACMDTFIYVGRLERVLAAIHGVLKPGGRLLFSTEKLEADDAGYRLTISGRYSHHPDYLRAVLEVAGFDIETMRDVDIRNESGCPIAGQFVCAVRS